MAAPVPAPATARATASVTALAAALVATLGAGTAGAQSDDGTGSDTPADDRISDGPGGLTTGNDKLELTISGQVNRGVLFYADGDGTDAAFVDNDNSSTRLRFVAESESFSPATIGALLEVEFQSNPSNLVSQRDEEDVGEDSFNERKLEVYARSDTWGQLLLGQGSTASDGTAEIDLSGTGIAGYSDVDDTGGGLIFRADGVLTNATVRSAFTNLDGLGRADRLRYDLPTWRDLTLSFSAASGEARDVALRWQRDRDPESWSAAAALSYSESGDGGFEGELGQDNTDDIGSRTAGSVSVLLGSGWNLTLAMGVADALERDLRFGYVKLGRRVARFDLGQTRLSIDYQQSRDIARAGERGTSYALQVVQQIDRFNADLFAVLRVYALDPGTGALLDDAGNLLDGLDAGTDVQDLDVAMIGMRVPF